LARIFVLHPLLDGKPEVDSCSADLLLHLLRSLLAVVHHVLQLIKIDIPSIRINGYNPWMSGPQTQQTRYAGVPAEQGVRLGDQLAHWVVGSEACTNVIFLSVT
jgi:hypothetical protein